MKKQKYVRPTVLVVKIKASVNFLQVSSVQSVSGTINRYGGGSAQSGRTKERSFWDEADGESDGGSLWDDIW